MIQITPVSQTSQATIVAVITALGAIVSPFIMAILVNYNARKLKQADYARQDAVADRLRAQQDEAASLLLQSNQKKEEVAKAQTATLDQIHALVNNHLLATQNQDGCTERSKTV